MSRLLTALRRVMAHPVVLHTNVWGSVYVLVALLLHLLDPQGFPRRALAVGAALMLTAMLGGTVTADRLRRGRWSVRRFRLWFMVACVVPWVLSCAVWLVGAPRYGLYGLLLAIIGTLMGFGIYRVGATFGFGIMFLVFAIVLNLAWDSYRFDPYLMLPVGGALLSYYVIVGLQSGYLLRREAERGSMLRVSRRDRRTINEEREKSERLLLNVLPAEVAEELKERGSTTPRRYESATVLFTDFQGFTLIAADMQPEELIAELDRCFSYFDQVSERYGLEKLKTIGDSYMCAGGLPIANSTHALDCTLAALEIQSFMNRMKEIKAEQQLPYWELRLGLHTGPLIAGVIGEKKFAYDVWGDTVNTASRLESGGVAGRVNISGATHQLVRDFFVCEHRGTVPAKHKGELDMYFVEGLRPEFRSAGEPRVPNQAFRQAYSRLAALGAPPPDG